MAQNRKPALIFLKNMAYRVRLPCGVSDKEGQPSEWDILVNHLGASDELLHWSYIWTWCQEPYRDALEDSPYTGLMDKITPIVAPSQAISPHKILRGCSSPLSMNTADIGTRGNYIGFRPILECVHPETMEPDPTRWTSLQDGEVIPLGTLYMNDQPIPIPQTPCADGDIADYKPGADLRIGKTHEDPAYQIRMIKCGHLFISDRNLIKNISWSDLDRCGLIYGEQTKIKPPKMPKELPKEIAGIKKTATSVLSKLPFSKK